MKTAGIWYYLGTTRLVQWRCGVVSFSNVRWDFTFNTRHSCHVLSLYVHFSLITCSKANEQFVLHSSSSVTGTEPTLFVLLFQKGDNVGTPINLATMSSVQSVLLNHWAVSSRIHRPCQEVCTVKSCSETAHRSERYLSLPFPVGAVQNS